MLFLSTKLPTLSRSISKTPLKKFLSIEEKECWFYFKPFEIVRHKMKFVKDKIVQHQLKGVYKIKCSHGKIYISETSRSFKTRIE